MSITDWINEGSDNSVLHLVELPFRWAAILIWANAIIFGAIVAVMTVALAVRAIA